MPAGPRKEKEYSKPSKKATREHKGDNSFPIIITSKVRKKAFKKAEN